MFVCLYFRSLNLFKKKLFQQLLLTNLNWKWYQNCKYNIVQQHYFFVFLVVVIIIK